MVNETNPPRIAPPLPEPLGSWIERAKGSAKPTADGNGSMLEPPPESESSSVALGDLDEFVLRVERVELPAQGAPSQSVVYGRLGSVADQAVAVRALWLPDSSWQVESVAPNGEKLTRIAEAGLARGAHDLHDVLQLLGATELQCTKLSWQIDTVERELRVFTAESSGLDVRWEVAPKVSFAVSDLGLDVLYPYDRRRRRLRGSIGGTLEIGVKLDFVLSNRVSPSNPFGLWLLTPKEKSITLQGLFDWVGQLGLGSPADLLPAWASSLQRTLTVENLALGVDLQEGKLSLIRGGVRWKPEGAARGELGLPSERTTTRPAFEFEEIWAGLEIANPFDNAESRFEFQCNARVLSKRFELKGYARSGGDWGLHGACLEELSITDAIAALAGRDITKGQGLFEDFDLSLEKPEIAFGSGGWFFFNSGVLVRRKSDKPFDLGVGELTIHPGLVRVETTPHGTRCTVTAAFALKINGGPIFDKIFLSLDYTSGRGQGQVEVNVQTAIRFLLKPGANVYDFPSDFPALAENKDLRIDLRGSYRSGPKGGFRFDASMSAVRLNPVIESLLESDLPPNFPNFVCSGLALSFDTSSGTFTFKGGVQVDALTFLVDVAHDGKSKKTEFAAAVVGDLNLGAFLKLFKLGDRVEDGSVALSAAGFRYSSSQDEDQLDLVATWGTSGRLSCVLHRDRRTPNARYEPAVVVYPGDTPWMTRGAVRWASDARKGLNLFTPPSREQVARAQGPVALLGSGSPEDLPRGVSLGASFNLKGTFVEKRLGLSAPIDVEVADKITLKLPSATLTLDATGKDLSLSASVQAPARLPSSTAPTTPTVSTAPAAPASPAPTTTTTPTVDEGKTVRFDTTLSPALILDKLSPAKDGAQSASKWREYLGNCVVLRNIGLTLHTKPKPAVTVFADVGINIGTWVSVAVQSVAIKLTPASLSADGLKKLSAEFDVQGAALSIDIPPWIKGGAAVLKVNDPTGLQVVGMGELQVLKKVRIGALAFVRFERKPDRYALDAGFGFVFATGLTFVVPPLPVIMITGVAGGFGYRAVPKLPTRAEDVAKNELVVALRGQTTPEDSSAAGMLGRLERFRQSVQVQDDAWCVVFGLSLTVAKMVEVALLVVLESRKTGFELALMGVANVTLGAKPTEALGAIELSVLARYSSSAGTLSVLGAITGESWLFDKNCKLQGAFAVCFWFTGEHAGDFLVSIGGYSPLAPVRAHYPALDRVGFDWKVNDEMSLYGRAYLTLDRYGLQLGAAAGLSYRTAKVTLEAHFSFDAIVEWAPLYYEARMRVSVHVEVRVAITLRLGLDVDVHLWGPPFGARVHVEVELWPFNPSFTVELGATREEALRQRNAITFDQVLDLAAGGKGLSTFKLASGGNPAKLVGADPTSDAARVHRFAAERPCPVDALRLSVETAVPALDVYLNDKTRKVASEGAETGLAVRPKDWKKVASEVTVRVFELIVRKERQDAHERRLTDIAWSVTAEKKPALESLWCLPEDRDRPWTVQKRELITALHITPPASAEGARFEGVQLLKETSLHGKGAATNATYYAAPKSAAPADVRAAMERDRGALRGALDKVGFKLAGCASRGFRPLEAQPLATARRAG